MSEASEAEAVRDDAVLPEVRWIGVVIMAVLVTASALLYVLPGDTDAHFAWPVAPEMTAMLMGACYGAGAYYFQRVSFGGSWHAVAAYLPGISAFTLLMGIATFAHWDRFNHDHVSFFAWLSLYVTTPVLVPLLYLRNRGADPGVPDPADAVVPEPVRLLAGIGGAALLVTAAVMFLAPSAAIDVWPWTLSDLTSRVVAAFLTAPGVAAVLLSRDPRWSAWKVFVRSAVISAALLLVAAVRAWDELDSAAVLTYVYLAGLGAACAGGIVLDRVMEMRAPGADSSG